MSHLFCFGMGYSALAFARRMAAKGWRVTGTSRSAHTLETFEREGFGALLFDGEHAIEGGRDKILSDVSHILVSIPPDGRGDPVIRVHGPDLARHAGHVAWAGYLSTTGVYGDRAGGWVDEDSALAPSSERGRRRLAAEQEWLRLHERSGLPVHIFRLPGIYGPGRNQIVQLEAGAARRIVKPGQVFCRIHVDDIAGALEASTERPRPGAAYNICDDEPAPPQDVVAFAADLMGLPRPPQIPFETAELAPMARSFYAESKRVSNARMKAELGYMLRYPTYREGLAALLASES